MELNCYRMKYFLLAFVILVPQLQAHSIRLFAMYEGNTLSGRAYSGSTGIANVDVKLSSPDGSLVATVKTDAKGNFSREMKKRMPLELSINLPDGHGAHYTLAWKEEETTSEQHSHEKTGEGGQQAKESQFSHENDPELERLRAEITRLENRNRMRDVVGGIGIVFGLAGVMSLITSRKRKNSTDA